MIWFGHLHPGGEGAEAEAGLIICKIDNCMRGERVLLNFNSYR